MGRQRQILHQEALRAQIVEMAKQIIVSEGLQALSIRRLTQQMDYSPGIVYHYFKDKEALVDAVLADGYGQILEGIRTVELPDTNNPAEQIRAVMDKFIEVALAQRVLYRLFLLSDSPEILKRTSVLMQGISDVSPSMGMLAEQIRQGVDTGIFKSCDPELAAQILWASVYGLVMKLIVETDVPEAQRRALIDYQMDVLLRGLKSESGG